MAEYIDREAMLKALENAEPDVCENYPDGYSDWGFGLRNIRDLIKGIPAADVVPVVRCNACRYLVNATVNSNGFLICHVNDMEIAPNDFCSYGERKEGKNG